MSEEYAEVPDWDLPDPDGTRRDPAELLDDVEAFLARFVAFPTEHARVATVLWAAHAHAVDVFDSTPRLALLSPEPGSGKSRVLEVLDLLVPRPLFSLNASAAALFRKVSDPAGSPTVLMDEADTVFGPRAGADHEDLRGWVNSGHRRGAKALRCVVRGKEISVEEFPAYAAVCLAGLDDLPDTIMTRSVIVRMRRRAPHEVVEQFRLRLHEEPGHVLRDRLAAWLAAAKDKLAVTYPDLPEGIEDRAADVWEPLVAVADAAGARWPERARCSAVALVAAASEAKGQSLGVRLLVDLRAAFRDAGEDKVPTEDLLKALNEMDESPWGAIGKPPKELDARGLARRLGKYGVRSKNIRYSGGVAKGYDRADLLDVWVRYIPDPPVAVDPSNGQKEKSDSKKEERREEDEEDSPSEGEPTLFPPASGRSATSATPLHPPGCEHRTDGGECYACWEAGRT